MASGALLAKARGGIDARVCPTRLVFPSILHFAPSLASRDRRNQGLGAHRDGGARHPRARQPLAQGPGGAAASDRLRPEARGAANAQHPARLAARHLDRSCARRKSRRPPKHLVLSALAALLSGFAGVAARRSARRLAEAAAEVDSCPRIRARADPAGGLVLAASGATAIFKDFFRPLSSFFSPHRR